MMKFNCETTINGPRSHLQQCFKFSRGLYIRWFTPKNNRLHYKKHVFMGSKHPDFFILSTDSLTCSCFWSVLTRSSKLREVLSRAEIVHLMRCSIASASSWPARFLCRQYDHYGTIYVIRISPNDTI